MEQMVDCRCVPVVSCIAMVLRVRGSVHLSALGLQVSIELIPRQLAGMQPAGLGRSDPNMNPTLPEPSSRFDFSIQVGFARTT